MIAGFLQLFSKGRHGDEPRVDWKAWTVLWPGIFEERRAFFLCIGCGKDCNHEYYMVHDPLWRSAVPDGRGMLCFDCLESRIGRKLTLADFNSAPINRDHMWNPRFAA